MNGPDTLRCADSPHRDDPQPRRDLTPTHAVALVVGITIGTGIFLKSSSMAQAVGTPALLLAAWAAGGAVAMAGALCFAELGALLPDAGGEYVYLRAAYGEIPGFLYACNSFVLGGASIAAYGAAVAIFIGDIHPLPHAAWQHTVRLFGAVCTLGVGAPQFVAVGVISVFALVNCAGVMLGGRVQSILTAAKLAAIVAVAAGAFALARGGGWTHFAAPEDGHGHGAAGFGAAMFAALWAYSGWQYLPMAAGELQEPRRNLPRAIIGGSVLVLGVYLLINVAYLYALPFGAVASANSTAYPHAPSVAARAVGTFLGRHAVPAAALVFLLSTIGSLNGTILTRARVSWACARDGLFFAPFGRLSPRTRVPLTALVLLCVWAALLAGSGTFDELTDMAVMSYALFWIPVALALPVLRRRLPLAPRPYRVPAYPLLPLAFVLAMVWIVISAFLTAPRESLSTLLLILLGLPLYPYFRRRAHRVERVDARQSREA